MPGSSFGTLFRVTTFGESHGAAIGVVIDSPPPGMALSPEDIQKDLDRRKPGTGPFASPRPEEDRVEILSGIHGGKTMGTPLAMLVRNRSQNPSDYDALKDLYRPGHADFGYQAKYGIRDWRGGGRSSGRETAARVAAGAVARKLLSQRGITVVAYSLEIGGIRAERVDHGEIEKNQVRSPDPALAQAMADRIARAREEGDSVGGIVEAEVRGCPAGWGDPVFDKLEALLAQAVMSVGGVRGVEIGCGFEAARMKGSEFNDPFTAVNGRVSTTSNHCGGVLGGISTGGDILLRAAVRPTPSISKTQDTVDTRGRPARVEVKGRHDPCIVPRAVPVIEAMIALVLVDRMLVQEAVGGRQDRTVRDP
jgi:chorismate synthase